MVVYKECMVIRCRINMICTPNLVKHGEFDFVKGSNESFMCDSRLPEPRGRIQLFILSLVLPGLIAVMSFFSFSVAI